MDAKIKEVEETQDRNKWDSLIEQVRNSKTGILELEFNEREEAVKVWKNFTNPHYRDNLKIKTKIRKNIVYLEDISRGKSNE